MKVSDILARILVKQDVGAVFGLQGGAVVHLFDSFERQGIKVIYTLHEGTAALAAAAYSKATDNIGCVVTTTGPGSTNAITGLLGAWQDSIPCLFISGQVRSNHTSYKKNVRQTATQEAKIIDIVRPITKYSKFISDPANLASELHEALTIAFDKRPGPVWIDIPLDYQWANIEFSDEIFPVPRRSSTSPLTSDHNLTGSLRLLQEAKNPLIVAGHGIRLGGAVELFSKLITKLQIPYVTTWTGADLRPTDEMLNLGIIGMCGQRGANKAVFEADLLLCLGTHLGIPHTTTLFNSYATQAKKIIVNIDKNQLENLNLEFDIKIESDLRAYLNWLDQNLNHSFTWDTQALTNFKSINWYTPEENGKLNSNLYQRTLSKNADSGSCFVVDGGGTALYAGFQSSVLKEGQRIICSSSMSSMGTGLAETIGVHLSGRFKKIFCIIGDGSFAMAMHDLQTISDLQIPVVISVINNGGYLAIRNTQKEFLDSRFYGTHPKWNLTLPSVEGLARAFKLKYLKFEHPKDLERLIDVLLNEKEPLLCEVIVDEEEPMLFKQGYVKNDDGTFTPLPLSEMFPFCTEN